VNGNKLAHTVWECKYHVVWIPKCRRKVIYGKLRMEIGRILRKLCEYKGVEIVEARACSDHIHMFLSIPPKYSVASILGYLKGKTSILVFERYSRIRHNFRGHRFWARGYYVNTVGLDEKKVRDYIRDQEENDRVEDKQEPETRNPFEGCK
jgi:putative transposase